MRPFRNKRILLSLLILAVLVGLPAWWIYHQVRQEWLDHALIAAIKATIPRRP